MARTAKPIRPKIPESWAHADWEPADAKALQMVAGATDENMPSAAQCRRAIDWIVNSACGTYDRSFVPGQTDVTQFREGRRDAGRQIVKLLKINLSALKGNG